MKKLANAIDQTTKIAAKIGSWLAIALVILICYDVLMRNVFNITSALYFELEWHLFASVFLLGTAYAFQQGQHVRVDVIYAKCSPKAKAIIDLVGTLIFLLPLCYVGIKYGIIFAYESWLFQESSPDPGGLPARYIIKSMIPISFALLLTQAIAFLFKQSLVLSGHSPEA